MDALRSDPELDRQTLVFYTSDNGAPSNHAVSQAGARRAGSESVGSAADLQAFC